MNDDTEPEEVRVSVDGAEFYSFVRAMKRGYRASDLGEVTLSVSGEKLTIETRRGGSVLPCAPAAQVTAHIQGGDFLRLASLVTDAKVAGPLEIVFAPSLGEFRLPHAGTKAKFG